MGSYPTIGRVYLEFITQHIKPYSVVVVVIPLHLPAKAHPKALDMVEHMQQVHKEIKKRIEAANARHKAKADIHRRRKVTFQEGDLVWVILTKKKAAI